MRSFVVQNRMEPVGTSRPEAAFSRTVNPPSRVGERLCQDLRCSSPRNFLRPFVQLGESPRVGMARVSVASLRVYTRKGRPR